MHLITVFLHQTFTSKLILCFPVGFLLQQYIRTYDKYLQSEIGAVIQTSDLQFVFFGSGNIIETF